ncbi:hypothetical protein [Thalassoroseus pseudoceratinae]|uniref:hypothetical protein n=1 Tax=Thalassoroseus pseudoceratinae TaxID=2713176 RepID=UPI00142064BC|nr:hypothetical protein [Thalassoroseus pseudoceratinae]
MKNYRLTLNWSCLLGMLCLLAVGCGESAPPPAADEQAKQVRQQINAFMESAQRSPRTAAQELAVMRESLDAYAENASGETAETYQAIADTAKELEAAYQSGASSDKIQQYFDKFNALLQELPS